MDGTLSPRTEYSYTGAQLDNGVGSNCQSWSGGSPSSSTWKMEIGYLAGNPLQAAIGLLPGVPSSEDTLQLATGLVQFSGTRGQLFCNMNNTLLKSGDDKFYNCAWTN